MVFRKKHVKRTLELIGMYAYQKVLAYRKKLSALLRRRDFPGRNQIFRGCRDRLSYAGNPGSQYSRKAGTSFRKCPNLLKINPARVCLH